MGVIHDRWVAYKQAQLAAAIGGGGGGAPSQVEIRTPDFSFANTYADPVDWVQVWRVWWPGGTLALTHELLGEAPTSFYLGLSDLAVYHRDSYVGVSPVAGVTSDGTVWGDTTPVAAGVYYLALTAVATEQPVVAVPKLPAGMLFAPAGDGGWAPMDLINGWHSLTASGGTACRYRKDGAGFVHLEGWLDGSTQTDGVFTVLPQGYRPSTGAVVVGVYNADDASMRELYVHENGEMGLNDAGVGAPSLTSVTFFAGAGVTV